MGRAARVVAGINNGSDTGVQTGGRGQSGTQKHVQRPIVGTQFFSDNINVSKQIVHIWHHATHDTQPHVMMSINQSWHNNMMSGINHLSVIRLQSRTNSRDPIVLDKDIADVKIRNIGIQRKDNAAFEKSALCCHVVFLRIKGGRSLRNYPA
ncbi:hypothetical protein KPSB59_1730013 [Klebsiella quasipneumoniae subsp. quasipneumoniae]|nr:hypothetical protein KPSB59_1730013 [Klebsiella quasipneumoniae subsp. quasipneumoniae]